MRKASEIFDSLKRLAPLHYKVDYDNVGLQIGSAGKGVRRALISLDPSLAAIKEAERSNCELLITHHPLIFNPVSTVTADERIGEAITRLIKADITLISMHTNLDAARGGVNDALAERIGLRNITDFPNYDARPGIPSIGRIGEVDGIPLGEFLQCLCKALLCDGCSFTDSGKEVRRVAVGGGSCGDYVKDAYNAGCDTFVTADVKYKYYREASELGINIIDCGHYATENVICPKLEEMLSAEFPNVEFSVSQNNTDVKKLFMLSGYQA